MAGVGKLTVLITNDDGSWFAQGLEIDYAAEAKSLEDLKPRFEDGIAATVREHLRVFGQLEGFLVPAPPEVWKRASRAEALVEVPIQRDPLASLESSRDLAAGRRAVIVPEALPFGRFSYFRQIRMTNDPRESSTFMGVALAVFQRHGVAVSNDTDGRTVLQKDQVLEVHHLPIDIHENLLARLGRRFGVDRQAFRDEEADLWRTVDG
jgi:hypothetical protein